MSVKINWDLGEAGGRTTGVTGKRSGASFWRRNDASCCGDEARADTPGKYQAVWAGPWQLTRDASDERPSENACTGGCASVERAKIVSIEEKLAKARQERPELHFLFSGPWPPYTFANIELEFKTQFGVS